MTIQVAIGYQCSFLSLGPIVPLVGDYDSFLRVARLPLFWKESASKELKLNWQQRWRVRVCDRTTSTTWDVHECFYFFFFECVLVTTCEHIVYEITTITLLRFVNYYYYLRIISIIIYCYMHFSKVENRLNTTYLTYIMSFILVFDGTCWILQ